MTTLIVLTGAPAPGSLQWDENILSSLHSNDVPGAIFSSRSPEGASGFSAQWRQVPTTGVRIDTNQPSIQGLPGNDLGDAVFLTNSQLTQQVQSERTSGWRSVSVTTLSLHSAEETLNDYYDQSFVLHEDLTTSQLSELRSQTTNLSDLQWSGVKTQVDSSESADDEQNSLPFQIVAEQLNNIKDVPSAQHLRRIEPQTVTMNLVVGIISLPSPRSVIVGRRWGREREMQLVEMLVGDDTRAGFEVTVWLSNESGRTHDTASRYALESQIQNLRPRDVVLLRNVALCAYQGRVHGQSLKGNVTKMNLLYRRKLDASDPAGLYSLKDLHQPSEMDPIKQKAKQVTRWLMNFVGENVPNSFGEASHARRAVLPPDTQ